MKTTYFGTQKRESSLDSSKKLGSTAGDRMVQHRYVARLRQGDSLSPMLFILVMDVLNSLIEKASNEGLL